MYMYMYMYIHVHVPAAGTGGGGGGGAAAELPPRLLTEFSLSRRGFRATMGEGRVTLEPLVSRRAPTTGAGGGAGSRGEGGAMGGDVEIQVLCEDYIIYMYMYIYMDPK